jgi:allantoate deiminase
LLDLNALPVDAAEIESHIEQLGQIGKHPDSGLFRTLYDDGWVEAMALVRSWMEEIGLETRLDAVGNLFGRLAGSDGGDAVLTGSHVDTVKQGGKYDGALGIHMAIAAVKVLSTHHGRPRRPLEVLVTCEEEGSRFPCTFWGARAMLGMIAPDEVDRLRDPDGVTIGEAMRARGFDPSRIGEAERRDVAAFVESHIEQGAILETEGYPLGVVSTITGQRWLRVRVSGRQDHAGTTPMDLRRDAVAGAAAMIERITSAAATLGRPAVATVGNILARPGATNVVPGICEFTVDTRHSDAGARRELLASIEQIMRDVAEQRGLGLDVETLMDHEPVPMDTGIRGVLEETIQRMGLRYLVMPSGAGHDSEIIAQRFPTAMLFVPSRDGRSHTPDEYTPIEQIVPGVRALAGTLYRLAYE